MSELILSVMSAHMTELVRPVEAETAGKVSVAMVALVWLLDFLAV